MRVRPTCRSKYGGGEVFCPVDASRLVPSSAASGQPEEVREAPEPEAPRPVELTSPLTASPLEKATPQAVEIRVATAPSGARVIRGDGRVLCRASPCSFETVQGRPITLRAKLGNHTGKTRLTPTSDETVQIALKSPRQSAAERRSRETVCQPPAGRRSKGSSDLKAPEWAL